LLGNAHRRAGDAVDVGREGLGDVRDPHPLRVADLGKSPGCTDMTPGRILDDNCA
jgi:hypothetical protein